MASLKVNANINISTTYVSFKLQVKRTARVGTSSIPAKCNLGNVSHTTAVYSRYWQRIDLQAILKTI